MTIYYLCRKQLSFGLPVKVQKIANLCEDESLRAPAVQAEHKSDGLEKLLDAGAELFLLHSASSSGVKDPRLDNELEKIFQGLREQERKEIKIERKKNKGTLKRTRKDFRCIINNKILQL